jgi:phage shock protein A
MKILDRLSNLLRSNLNSAIDKMSDPGKEVDLLLEQMEDESRRARLALRDNLAQEKLCQKRVDEAFRNVARWQEHAERAARAGEDELAKEALRRVDEAERQLDAAEKNLAEQSHIVARMTDQIRQNDRKLLEIKARKETLKARARTAKGAIDGEGDAFSRFDNLVSQIEQNEHQAEAMADIAADPTLSRTLQTDRDRKTEEKFDRLLPASAGKAGQSHDEMDARLAALKARLDKRGEGS